MQIISIGEALFCHCLICCKLTIDVAITIIIPNIPCNYSQVVYYVSRKPSSPGSRSFQGRQSGVKTWGVVSWVLVWKLGVSCTVLKNVHRRRHIAQNWGCEPRNFNLFIHKSFNFWRVTTFRKCSPVIFQYIIGHGDPRPHSKILGTCHSNLPGFTPMTRFISAAGTQEATRVYNSPNIE